MKPAVPTAESRLEDLYPKLGPWTEAALWFGRGERSEPPATSLADELQVIVQQRLAALTLAYIAESQIDVTPQHLRTLQQSAFVWNSLSRTATQRAPAEFTEWQLEAPWYAVSKGPGIARLYPRPELRPFSDVDIVIKPEHFKTTVTALAVDAWSEEKRNRQPWDYFKRYCREGLNLARPDGGRIDVHHHIPPWLWSENLDIAAMLQRSIFVRMHDREFRCLSDTDNLIVAALHIVSDRNRPGQSLLVWRDIVELALAAPVEDVILRARETGLGSWLAAVLRALPAKFGTEPLARALEPHQCAMPHETRLAALLSPRATRCGVIVTQMLRLPLPNAVAYFAGMLVPSAAFLRERFPNERARYRRWWRDARTSHFSGVRDGNS